MIEAPANAGKKTVLVVDPDPGVCQVIYEILKSKFSVKMASIQADAIRILETDSVDLLLTEASVKRISSLELATRAKKKKPQLPVVAMSVCRADLQELERSSSGAVDAAILKPFDNDEISGILEKFLRR